MTDGSNSGIERQLSELLAASKSALKVADMASLAAIEQELTAAIAVLENCPADFRHKVVERHRPLLKQVAGMLAASVNGAKSAQSEFSKVMDRMQKFSTYDESGDVKNDIFPLITSSRTA